jgi:hypothetical protein
VSNVPSIIFFHSFLQTSLQKLFIFIFLFSYDFTKIKIKSFEYPKSIRNYEKKMLGTSDAWSMNSSYQQPNVLYWRFSGTFPIRAWLSWNTTVQTGWWWPSNLQTDSFVAPLWPSQDISFSNRISFLHLEKKRMSTLEWPMLWRITINS